MTDTCTPEELAAAPTRHQTPDKPQRLSVLVAIASYGNAQDHFLREVIAEYLKLEMDCRIVVLSNISKAVPGAETLVGLPSRDSYSLPFAHRKLFVDNAGKYDVYVYTEDDTLITPANLWAFLEVQKMLGDDEVAGYLRSEADAQGRRYIVSANHHFRWRPETVFRRGSHRFAQFSNQHSGCFIVTRRQLARAIDSGGFTLKPRADRYGMLETAASDIYTQCGLKRVICLTRIDDFIVPHLANKYHGQMGVPADAFLAQACTISNLTPGEAEVPALIEPETRAPGFRWSKHLYRKADQDLLARVAPEVRTVLTVGATMGDDEAELMTRGMYVTAVPLDTVFGATLAARGVEVQPGDPFRALAALARRTFDAVLVPDLLHLAQDPAALLSSIARTLAPHGTLLATVSNTTGWSWQLRDWRHKRWRWARPDFLRYGAHPVSAGRLRQWCRAADLRATAITPLDLGVRLPLRSRTLEELLATKLLVEARRSQR